MNPPLRTEDDRRALVEGLLDGTIDCIATDHAPHARHEKDVPFEEAPFGVTGLETAFARAAHVPRRAGRGTARDAARAAVRRAGAGARAPRAADRRRRAREPRPARPRRGVDGARGRFRSRSANSWLLGRRSRRRRQDRRRRPGGVRGVSPTATSLLEDGTVFRGRSVAAEGGAFGEAVFTTGDDRLPGDRHRPELRGAARLLHGADGRQLRRRRTRGSSRRRRTRGRC